MNFQICYEAPEMSTPFLRVISSSTYKNQPVRFGFYIFQKFRRISRQNFEWIVGRINRQFTQFKLGWCSNIDNGIIGQTVFDISRRYPTIRVYNNVKMRLRCKSEILAQKIHFFLTIEILIKNIFFSKIEILAKSDLWSKIKIFAQNPKIEISTKSDLWSKIKILAQNRILPGRKYFQLCLPHSSRQTGVSLSCAPAPQNCT